MPPRRPVSGRSQSPRARYAQELTALRKARKLSLRALGEAVCSDYSHLGHMEHGHTVGGPELAQELDKFYGTTHLVVLWELAIRDPAQFRERYRRYMSLEAEATGLQHYGPSVVHGLLQTDAYAREALTAGGARGEELSQQVEARMGRRELLADGSNAPHFRAILAEAVLRVPLRDAQAWRSQLERLVESAERPNIALHVLPQGAGLHGLVSTDVMLLRLGDGRTVAYTENDVHCELIEETSSVERLQRAYDAVRDMALSPAESQKFLTQMLEEAPCVPST